MRGRAVLGPVRTFRWSRGLGHFPGWWWSATTSRHVLMAKHGVYDLRQHLEEVLNPVLRQWNIFGRNDFTAHGEKVRERLAAFLEKMEHVQIPKFEGHRDRAPARERARA